MTPRSSSRSNALAVIALSLVVASMGLAACFSDRATTTATLGSANCTAPANAAGATLIFIRSFVFQPATVHVKAGGSVAWVNCEPTAIPHTSTSDGAAWESGTLNPNASFIRAFPAVGTFPYHCNIHPSMKATVIVE